MSGTGEVDPSPPTGSPDPGVHGESPQPPGPPAHPPAHDPWPAAPGGTDGTAAPFASFRQTLHAVPLPRWVAPLFGLFTVGLLPWIVWLALTLPRRQSDDRYELAWVGYDIGLVCALGATMWLARRRSTWIEVVAAVTATMLVVDAWFDVLSSRPGLDTWEAVADAVIFELPIAALCLWLTRNAEQVRRRRARALFGIAYAGRVLAQNLAAEPRGSEQPTDPQGALLASPPPVREP
jgi:hypothetical protein